MSNIELKEKFYTVIFGTDTPAGKRFDIALIIAIILSVLTLMAESVSDLTDNYYIYIRTLEWILTILFTVEYILRIYCSPNPRHYITSFYGIIDLISILPTYVSLLVPGVNFLLVIRIMRFLRIFRVLKLVRYLTEANTLVRSMAHARRKISVFFLSVLVLATIFGALMYMVEGPENGFSSIPTSIYWTIVTITTVGYGDITPQTPLGQFIAASAMLMGYSILAVPTGIFTAELAHEISRERLNIICPNCSAVGHDHDAQYCKMCGSKLKP
ncbi:ion transporter [Agarilytica rhodophyticola]|uniref:ion transporter n=1 Tax=Agarilytica rhodophyticola TaxID=1737490 RepID=UPI000B346360|nr:ion transporter [Agarilytica rhodophyticola]